MTKDEIPMTKRARVTWVAMGFVLVVGGVAGCASQLMPTPNLFTGSSVDPFADVPAPLRTPYSEVIYVTDRAPVAAGDGQVQYGYGRSRTLAFGTVRVGFGRHVSWEQLVAASRSRLRLLNLSLHVDQVTETGRFAPSPPYWEQDASGKFVESPADVAQDQASEVAFKQMIQQRLDLGPSKEVYVYVHGFANTFDESVQVLSQVWHFLGRRGVPVAYSWPSGRAGLRGYPYDRESGEYTILHLKRLLRLLGECPGVERVHVLAHSRGTDVALTALHEIHLECLAAGQRTRDVLKLETLVLASPDIDTDLALQKLTDEQFFHVPKATVIYLSEGDLALKLANWLFLGIARLGRLQPDDLKPQDRALLKRLEQVQFVDTFDVSTGLLGHTDFYYNPAVSSDLILVLRDRRLPGEEHGRPLAPEKGGFWGIGPWYPNGK
jgi:esterase/lipase superfamily enzyme